MKPTEKETITKVNSDITLIQNPNGLTFGTDALLLSAYVRRSPYANAAEFGAGSGIISLLLAKREKLRHIDAVEIQPEYHSITDRNISLNGLDDKISAVRTDIRELSGSYDVIFSNPPYMKTDCGKRNEDDGKYIARHVVCGSIADFCGSAGRALKFGGIFYCVYRPDRAIDLICAMRNAGIEPKRITFVYPTSGHKPSLMLTEGKRGAGAGVIVTKPLIIYKDDSGNMTDSMKYIYENGDFEDEYRK